MSIVALCSNLFGLHNVKMLSESEIMAVFSVKSAIIGDDVKLYHLNVLLDPATGIVEDAEVCILAACTKEYVIMLNIHLSPFSH